MKKLLNFFTVPITEEKLDEAISFSKFEKMHEMEREGKFGTKRLKPANKADIRTYKTRKGKVGSYKEELSQEDVYYVTEQVSKNLLLNYYK